VDAHLSERIHDVVVVGAGPAGCRMARDVALRGFDVVVLEEHRVVGMPCHCSGLVSPRAMELADVGTDIIENTIRGAVIHAPGSRPVTIGGDRVHAYAIDRSELDRRLATQAEAAGATILRQSRFLRFSLVGRASGRLADGAVVVQVQREGVKTELRARLLVGADGALSLVAQQMRGSRAKGGVAGLGALAEYDRNSLEDHVEVFLDPRSAPGWFGWTIPLGAGMARLGTGSADGIKPLESFDRLRKSFPDSFGAARVHSHSGGTIALWKPTPMVGDRVMLVGDAACQVKPMSGGGIYAALVAAGLAAGVASEALQRGDVSARSLRPYPRRWHRSVGSELQRQYDMRRAFQRLTTHDLQGLLSLVQHRAMRATVDSAGDIDFSSRLVAQVGLHRPGLLLRLMPWPRFPMAWLRPR
jgi:geranylgeranyl reductase family protein